MTNLLFFQIKRCSITYLGRGELVTFNDATKMTHYSFECAIQDLSSWDNIGFEALISFAEIDY